MTDPVIVIDRKTPGGTRVVVTYHGLAQGLTIRLDDGVDEPTHLARVSAGAPHGYTHALAATDPRSGRAAFVGITTREVDALHRVQREDRAARELAARTREQEMAALMREPLPVGWIQTKEGEGYDGCIVDPGTVLSARDAMLRGLVPPESRWVVVAWRREYIRHDGMSQGVGADRGWLYFHRLRPFAVAEEGNEATC